MQFLLRPPVSAGEGETSSTFLSSLLPPVKHGRHFAAQKSSELPCIPLLGTESEKGAAFQIPLFGKKGGAVDGMGRPVCVSYINSNRRGCVLQY